MIKSILTYTLIIGILFFLGIKIHTYFIEKQNIKLDFSLQNIYLFHAVFSLIVSIIFLLISNIKTFYEQLGFIYLGVLTLKIILFCIVFYNPILSSEELIQAERISLLIPMTIFLIIEVYFVSKVIQKNNIKKDIYS